MKQEKLKRIRSVAVYCASREPNSPEYAEAVIAFGRYLAERKAEMLRRADAVVALPGSFGTWDELFDALALRKMKTGHKHPVGLLNICGYYDPILALVEQSVQLGLTSPGDRNLLKVAKTPEQLFKQLAGSLVLDETEFPGTQGDISLKE